MNLAPRSAVGVHGGMGPAATTDFMSKLRAATPAACDQDPLPLIVHCVPQIPDRSSAILAGTEWPMAFQHSRHADLCIDATLALAQACVRHSLGLTTKGPPT